MTAEASNKHTLTYRTVRGVDIQLDYVLHERDSGKKLPIVVWFHGGGLLQGSRRTAPTKYDLCLVSADYRLAPQTRLPDILSDLAHLFSFLTSRAFAAATGDRLDPDRIVTVGSSAGGWLSLLGGLDIGPRDDDTRDEALAGRVKGVVGIYPITSVEHEFWHTKQHRKSFPKLVRKVARGQADMYCESHNHDDEDRNKMYTYMIQEGILEQLLLDGTDVNPSAFTVAKAIASGRTVEPVPPVYLVHGTADDKVPHAQSVEVVEALRARGLECEYEERAGLDHSFDHDEQEEMAPMWEWIVAKLRE
ncbi:hypothetical protein JCM11491_000551 [Sporobolomyces phaffii]